MMSAELTGIKRRRATGELTDTSSRKKALRAAPGKAATTKALSHGAVTANSATAASTSPACPLTRILREYGLLESVISCLFPSDLLSLALSSKAIYNAIMPRPESLDNLLSIIPCSGNGTNIRQHKHKKSQYFYVYNCNEFAQCSSAPGHHLNIESRPCISCRVTTCNECRIHCVYQSIYDAPTDPEDLPNFSGFVLLDPFEVAILSPLHLPSQFDDPPTPCCVWRNPAIAGPYHDQGFLDMPLEAQQAGTPQRIDDVLDVDLGRTSLTTWSASSQFGFPSPVLYTLCDVAEKRKLFLCEHCFQDAPKGYRAIMPALPKMQWLNESLDLSAKSLEGCHCSLRSRILDRWQCVKCYEGEALTVNTIHDNAPTSEKRQCRCGSNCKRLLCMWCWGEVIEGREVFERVYVEQGAHTRVQAESN